MLLIYPLLLLKYLLFCLFNINLNINGINAIYIIKLLKYSKNIFSIKKSFLLKNNFSKNLYSFIIDAKLYLYVNVYIIGNIK